MKFFLFFLFVVFTSTEAITNYMGTDIQKCINCLCHARSGCYSRFNCARYSVNMDYWTIAKSPVVDENDAPNSEASYKKCMRNENCIVATIVQYIEAIGERDCNCDGQFDCKDRFAIHLFGSQCTNPMFNTTYARRFNDCAKSIGVNQMLAEEGYDGCIPEVF